MKTPAQIWDVEPSPVMPNGFKSRLKIASAYRPSDDKTHSLSDEDRAYLSYRLYEKLIYKSVDDGCIKIKCTARNLNLAGVHAIPSRLSLLAAGKTIYGNGRIRMFCGVKNCVNPEHFAETLEDLDDAEGLQELWGVEPRNIPVPTGLLSRLIAAQGSRRHPGTPLTETDRQYLAFRLGSRSVHQLDECVITDNTRCRIWLSREDGTEASIRAARASVLAAGRPLDMLKVVTARCKTKNCINPEHLDVQARVRHMDQISDAGVQAKQLAQQQNKSHYQIPSSLVSLIRETAQTRGDITRLSKQHGIDLSTVSRIVSGQTRKEVGMATANIFSGLGARHVAHD